MDNRKFVRAAQPGSRKRRVLRISTVAGLALVVSAYLASIAANAASREQQTLHLSAAVGKKDKAQIHALLAQGADPNAPMEAPTGFAETVRIAFHLRRPPTHETTIFMYAVGHCDDAIVQLLLDAGGDVHDQTSSGATALNIAAGNLFWYPALNRNLVLLVEHGADVNHSNHYGDTPLSATADKTPDLTYLLAQGANPNHADMHGITPLMVASSLGNSASVRALLRAGANLNVRGALGITALMVAAQEGRSEIVLLLLQNGADAMLQDQSGKTAEDYALDNHQAAIARNIRQYRLHKPTK